jgi:hypothetical protein
VHILNIHLQSVYIRYFISYMYKILNITTFLFPLIMYHRKLDEEETQFSIDYYRLATVSCYRLLSEANTVMSVTKWISPFL